MSGRWKRTRRGFLLVEVVGYMAMFALVLGLSMTAFYSGWQQHRRLARNAEEIARAVEAGERWRTDIRSAAGGVRLEQGGEGAVLRVPGAAGEIRYWFEKGVVYRSEAVWTQEVMRAASSEMRRVNGLEASDGWSWELELASKAEAARVRPLFTFKAVRLP